MILTLRHGVAIHWRNEMYDQHERAELDALYEYPVLKEFEEHIEKVEEYLKVLKDLERDIWQYARHQTLELEYSALEVLPYIRWFLLTVRNSHTIQREMSSVIQETDMFEQHPNLGCEGCFNCVPHPVPSED